ncbi:MAG: pilin [Candidatus Paceibacterota bacterium]|jgi:uncharacterized membrane protein
MKKILIGSGVALFPLLTLAAGLTDLADKVSELFNKALPLLISFAVIYFAWQVIQYTIAGDEGKKENAKMGILWGIVGLFVIVSVWGLVGFLGDTLDIEAGGGISLPELPQGE